MVPRYHILFGGLFSVALFLSFSQIKLGGMLTIFLSSFLIDVDHYIYYIYKKRDFSLTNAFKWFTKKWKMFSSLSRKKRNNYYGCFLFLHGVEILIILSFLGMLWNFFYFVLIGFSFHLFLDVLYARTFYDRWDKVSLIVDFLKFQKLEQIDTDKK